LARLKDIVALEQGYLRLQRRRLAFISLVTKAAQDQFSPTDRELRRLVLAFLRVQTETARATALLGTAETMAPAQPKAVRTRKAANT
jgi:hypothetical protein